MKRQLVLISFLALAACGGSGDAESGGAPASSNAANTAEVAATPEARGRKQFNECAVCHSVKVGDAHRIGPNLYAITGAPAGQLENFAYSKAMAEAGIVWTDENLDAFIENPQAFMRGNRMAYVGQRDAQKRADIIAYMKTLK